MELRVKQDDGKPRSEASGCRLVLGFSVLSGGFCAWLCSTVLCLALLHHPFVPTAPQPTFNGNTSECPKPPLTPKGWLGACPLADTPQTTPSAPQPTPNGNTSQVVGADVFPLGVGWGAEGVAWGIRAVCPCATESWDVFSRSRHRSLP